MPLNSRNIGSQFFAFNLVLLFLIFFTSSFDIFLNLKLGGFSLRISYLLISFFIFINIISNKFSIQFLGLPYFLLWTTTLVAFVFNTTLLSRNVGYLFWHFVHFMFLFFLPNAIDSKEKFYKLFRWYVISFGLLAGLGIVQFILGVIGIDFFVEQWWFSRLPRVNGFSYEPSYYATYLIIGWTICFSMYINEVYIFSKRRSIFLLGLITISIFLSTSRMGILFMVLVASFYFSQIFLKTVLSLKISKQKFYFIQFIGLLAIFSFLIAVPIILTKYQFLLEGTGVQGRSSHSATQRFGPMIDLWNIFLSNPLEGRSLGGIPSALGEYYGTRITTVEQAKQIEGVNIFLEVLVASGVVGFIFFAMYLVNLFRSLIRLKLRLKTYAEVNSGIIQALVLSLFVELLILCFNQNILRLYLWINISMLNAAYFAFKKESLNHIR